MYMNLNDVANKSDDSVVCYCTNTSPLTREVENWQMRANIKMPQDYKVKYLINQWFCKDNRQPKLSKIIEGDVD